MLKKYYLAYPSYIIYKYILRDPQKAAVSKCYWEDKERKFLNHYDLNSESVIFDIGGYVGEFTDLIDQKTNGQIYAFEPVEEYYNILTERFKNKENIKLYNIGLSDKTEIVEMGIEGEKSSSETTDAPSSQKVKVQFQDIKEFIESNNITKIDLMQMNIEGGEYDLLKRLIDTELVKIVQNIQIQFHKISGTSEKDRSDLMKQLSQTHKIIFEYPFVWDGLKLKP